MGSQARVLFIAGLVLIPAIALGAISNLDAETVRLAYLDPGSGSFMIQFLVAALAGIAVTSRLYWAKIKSLLGITSADSDEDGDDDE